MRLLIPFVALLLMLAGCAGQDSGPAAGDSTATDALPESSAGTNESAEVFLDLPPTANITSSIVNGTVPFVANFTLDGTDPEGAMLMWRLDANGNGTFDVEGTGLPANAEFTFELPGEYLAVLEVSDGNHTINATVLVIAAEGIAPPYQHAEGGISGTSGVCHGAPDTGTGKSTIEIDVMTWGEAFTLTFRSGAAHVAYEFTNNAGDDLKSGHGGLSGGGWGFSGTVPDGATSLIVFACENTFDETYVYDAGTKP